MASLDEKTVECNNCKKCYPILFNFAEPNRFGEYNQGKGCDATISLAGVRGHYGSCIDDERNVVWMLGKPKNLVIGKQLCDECIKTFLNKRILLRHDILSMSYEDLNFCSCKDCLEEIEYRKINV